MRKPLIATLLSAAAILASCTGCGTVLGIGPEHIKKDSLEPSGVIRSIDIASGSGTINLSTGPAVEVHRTVRYNGDAPDGLSGPVDGRLTLGNCAHCSTDYEITAPAGTVLDLNAGSGRIHVVGFTAAVTATADSGDINAEHLTGKVRLTTDSGDITANGLADATALKAGSGDITAAFVSPAKTITANTGSGNVDLQVPAGPYRITSDTSSGAKHIETPQAPTAAHTIQVKTGSGDIRITSTP
uniref:DUF4097 domain-containing protein n=1 Tax=Streptomyces sp. NBC_00003 TaxID=2903608 RepID=A0AAU2VC70_9ACTN